MNKRRPQRREKEEKRNKREREREEKQKRDRGETKRHVREERKQKGVEGRGGEEQEEGKETEGERGKERGMEGSREGRQLGGCGPYTPGAGRWVARTPHQLPPTCLPQLGRLSTRTHGQQPGQNDACFPRKQVCSTCVPPGSRSIRRKWSRGRTGWSVAHLPQVHAD